MSYSRWSNSCWYSFYRDSNSRSKKDQIFSLCGIIDFTYEQIKSDIGDCLSQVLKIEKNHTVKEVAELRSYMEEFIADVESDEVIGIFEELDRTKDLASFVLKAEECLSRSNYKDPALKESMDVINTPLEKLPLIMNSLHFEESKRILNDRFTGILP